jgi:nickel/cobalt transporter (NicO) family protein
VNATTPALLAAAAGVGFGHAILPDHWLPLAVFGRSHRYPISRVARLSGLAGVAHVLVSIVLGAAIILVGLQFRSAVQSAQDAIVGGLLVITGVAFVIVELSGHDHDHDHLPDAEHACDDPAGHTHARPDEAHTTAAANRGLRGLASVMVPFGAAASPDLTILPVFLAATTAGLTTAIGSLVIFAAVTISTIVGLTLTACFGGWRIKGLWLERWGNACTALVLIVIGALILAGVI